MNQRDGDSPEARDLAWLRQQLVDQQEMVRQLRQQVSMLQNELDGATNMPSPLAPGLPPSNSFVHRSTATDSLLPPRAPTLLPSPVVVPVGFAPTSLSLPPQDGLDFGTVAKMSDSVLEALPYGMVTLDSSGRVLTYNDTEARLSGVPIDRVLGKNFFEDVAPCTRVRAFQGRFLEMVANPSLVRVQTFDFVFRFDHSEQQVSIMIVPARTRGQFRLAMTRRTIIRN
jgi:photoactive yellow protein